jgi:phenylpyruvate tautomerase PptA (4-oxalocrotonate tautomerase family)
MEGKHGEERLLAAGRCILTALIEAFHIPEDDCFQVFHGHKRHEFVYSPSYLGVLRSDELLYIQITAKSGRTEEQKRRLYDRLAALLHERCGLRKEDVFVQLLETEFADWSFGLGEAQMLR